jgi:hypothetical protein
VVNGNSGEVIKSEVLICSPLLTFATPSDKILSSFLDFSFLFESSELLIAFTNPSTKESQSEIDTPSFQIKSEAFLNSSSVRGLPNLIAKASPLPVPITRDFN